MTGPEATRFADVRAALSAVEATSGLAVVDGALIPEPEIPPIPEVCWRGPFQMYRTALARNTEAADALHFGVFAVVAGLVVGRRAFHRAGFKLFPNIYGCLIGPTGRGRKTTAMRRGAQLLQDTEVGVSTVSTASWEGLLDELAESANRRVLFAPGEFRSLAAKARQDGGAAIVPGLTDLYDCPPELRHKTRSKDARAERPLVAALTASTIEWFREGFERTAVEGGFMNRWTFFDGTPKAPMPFPERPASEPWKSTVEALRNVDARLRFSEEANPTEIRLAAGSRDRWAEAYTEAYGWCHADELLAKMAERLPNQALKLAMLYALLEDTGDEIQPAQLEAALAFMAWQRDTHRRVFEGFGDPERKRLEDRICGRLERLHAKGRKPTRRELQQSIGGKTTAEDFNRAFRALLEAECITTDNDTGTVMLNRR